MRYVVLLHETDPSAWERATEQERDEVIAAHARFDRALRDRDALVAGAALAPAEDSRHLVGAVVTDGPFAESAEQLTGLYLVALPDLATAAELAALLPRGYHVEVRPTVDIEGHDG